VSFTTDYLAEAAQILARLDPAAINRVVDHLVNLRERGGRLFFLGVGGSAANASHAVNDFRKITQIEAYCPTDNVSELTARGNDEGWDTVFVNWLRGSRLSKRDMVFVLSVGGGDLEHNISPNLVRAAA
jgi:D-sedoheptulose 7-phosphate isomerase